LVVTLALLSAFFILMPHQALAQDIGAVGTSTPPAGGPPGPPPIATPLCPKNNSIDVTARNNNSAQAQALFTVANNVGTLFPISSAINACLTNITSAIQSLSTIGSAVPDPMGIIDGIVSTIVANIASQVINSTCSSIVASINSVQQSLLNITKICLPMPSFGGFDVPQWNQQGCSGGTQFNLLTSTGVPSSAAVYNYSQYLQPEQ
jgi:hypothetical protein